ncbi:MAG TPA: hypothetical protein VG964_00250 [Candidatus Saccharimonadales bacterium]|nr:hypothetical protein [Candidatus Saccharimonadales bacterium]
MKDEKFLGLSNIEQIAAGVFGSFNIGAPVAGSFTNWVERSECRPVPTVPMSSATEMQCSVPVKTVELAGGMAIIITSAFAVAAAVSFLKRKAT